MQKQPRDPSLENRKVKEVVADEGNVPGRPTTSAVFIIALLIGAVLLLIHLLRS